MTIWEAGLHILWVGFCRLRRHTDHVVQVAPPAICVVDTVGAGDRFQAALLAKLYEQGSGNPREAVANLSQQQLEELLNFAVKAARITCRKRGAYLPFRTELFGLND